MDLYVTFSAALEEMAAGGCSSALVAAVDQAVADVEARTLGRFKVSWHVPDASVSTEGFDLDSWDDLCKRSRPAVDAEAADTGRRRLHLMALRDTHTQQEPMAGYAKIKLLNQHTLTPKASGDLIGALDLVEGGVGASTAAATKRLCGGLSYLGCVVVRLSTPALLPPARPSLVSAPRALC